MRIRFNRLVSLILVAIYLVSCAAPAAPAHIPNTAAGTAPAAAVSTSTTAPTKISPTTAAVPAVSPTNAPSGPASEISLKDALSTLQPQDVFTNFYQITQVPRPSGYMDQIRPFLVQFGQGLELETIVDDAGNVIIRKPATAGMENRQVVVLQAHMDMVAQPADGSFDFKTAPIQAYVDGDYVVAGGTTLGADDGMGMAIIMSVLQSKTLKTGPIYYANALTIRDRVKAMIDAAEPSPRAVIFDASAQDQIDLTSTDMLKSLIKELCAKGIAVYFADVHTPVRQFSRRAGLLEVIGEDHVFPTVDLAVRFIEMTT